VPARQIAAADRTDLSPGPRQQYPGEIPGNPYRYGFLLGRTLDPVGDGCSGQTIGKKGTAVTNSFARRLCLCAEAGGALYDDNKNISGVIVPSVSWQMTESPPIPPPMAPLIGCGFSAEAVGSPNQAKVRASVGCRG
jgi:hypothetical protein